ncbi:MAG: TetR family transcriptional regulator [Solirubrobacteraceae bacterium]
MATERSGRQDRAEARRERILRATLEVIGEAGIAAVTHRAVAGRADVPLGSMTYYFASKDDLLRESLLLFVEEEVVRLHALAESIVGSGLTVEQIAQAFAEELASHAHAERVLTVAQFELYLESARNEALQAAAARCFTAYEDVTEAALRAVGVEDPGATALFVALSDGLALRRLAAPGLVQPELRDGLLQLIRSLPGAAAAD